MGDLPAGEGPDQLFDLCDPVDIRVTLAPKEGEMIYFPSSIGDTTMVEDAEFDVAITVGPRDVGAVGDRRPSVRLGPSPDIAGEATDEGLFLNTGNNYTEVVGASGDAFGYFELIMDLNFVSETHGAAGLSTYDEVAAFFNSVTEVSGRLDFRYCDESLYDAGCPERTAIELPYRTKITYTNDCTFE